MSAIVISTVEGVLTRPEETLPTADPYLAGIDLIAVLNERWPVGYVTTTTTASKARQWLRDSPAPDGVFVLASTPDNLGETVLAELGRRQDRCQFFLGGSAAGFATLMKYGVATLFVRNQSFLLSDWKRTSSWKDQNDNDKRQRPVERSQDRP